MWFLPIAAIFAAGVVLFFNHPSFGRMPRGARLERILRSPNYAGGEFRNLTPTQMLTGGRSRFSMVGEFLLRKVDGLRPATDLPTVRCDMGAFDPRREVVVWLGHSSVFIQTGGKRILVDPVLVKAAPIAAANRPFRGTAIYTPDDIPAIDVLVISHDHWDHLDYSTVRAIRDRVEVVVCPLGVGEHFEYWGYDPARIVEMDWGEHAAVAGMAVHCLPARHFSGRGLRSNRTLWASFLIESPARRIYISGDGGYDNHFKQVAERFGRIDLAVVENGQYNQQWRYIHMLPGEVVKAAQDLSPRQLLTVHHSKYALALHPWREPLDSISAAALRDSLPLLTPMIGEPVDMENPGFSGQWWR